MPPPSPSTLPSTHLIISNSERQCHLGTNVSKLFSSWRFTVQAERLAWSSQVAVPGTWRKWGIGGDWKRHREYCETDATWQRRYSCQKRLFFGTEAAFPFLRKMPFKPIQGLCLYSTITKQFLLSDLICTHGDHETKVHWIKVEDNHQRHFHRTWVGVSC